MDNFSKEEEEEAKVMADFFVDLVENNTAKIKYYLADDIVLDWFGKTIKKDKVSPFLNSTVNKVTHYLNTIVPAESVAFRESHIVKISKETPVVYTPVSPGNGDMVTPPKHTQPSTSSLELLSPLKKQKLEEPPPEEINETVEDESEEPKIKYLTAEGAVEFHKPSNKKLQPENKWKRPMKLHIGYTSNNNRDSTIYLIIYEGNVKCRRNLYSEFCEADKVEEKK